ncbi:MAG: hypothetical protein R3B72_23890 [Polyangiaceae bacterium]
MTFERSRPWWLFLLAVGCSDVRAPPSPPAPSSTQSRSTSTSVTLPSASATAPTPAPAALPSAPASSSPSVAASADPPLSPSVDLELTLDRPRQVAPRFGGGGSETLQRFVLQLKTAPAQILPLGDLRQTMCWLTRPEGALVGVACYSNAVGFSLTIDLPHGGISRVVAEEGLESGRVLRHWVVGRLRLPDDHDLHFSIIDRAQDLVMDEGVVAITTSP